jgi:hypothetical protein
MAWVLAKEAQTESWRDDRIGRPAFIWKRKNDHLGAGRLASKTQQRVTHPSQMIRRGTDEQRSTRSAEFARANAVTACCHSSALTRNHGGIIQRDLIGQRTGFQRATLAGIWCEHHLVRSCNAGVGSHYRWHKGGDQRPSWILTQGVIHLPYCVSCQICCVVCWRRLTCVE